MAVTSIWAVHGDNVATVMKYIANRDKSIYSYEYWNDPQLLLPQQGADYNSVRS